MNSRFNQRCFILSLDQLLLIGVPRKIIPTQCTIFQKDRRRVNEGDFLMKCHPVMHKTKFAGLIGTLCCVNYIGTFYIAHVKISQVIY